MELGFLKVVVRQREYLADSGANELGFAIRAYRSTRHVLHIQIRFCALHDT
jgi:hypothetical protein